MRDGQPALVVAAQQDTVVDSPLVGGAGSGAPTPAWAQRPRPVAPAQSGTEVVFPTGIIVAADENPIYQRTTADDAGTAEVYLNLLDAELAEDGSEHEMVAYSSGAGRAHASA